MVTCLSKKRERRLPIKRDVRIYKMSIAFCIAVVAFDLRATFNSYDYENGRSESDLVVEKVLGINVTGCYNLYRIRNDNEMWKERGDYQLINHRFDEDKMNADGTWIETVPIHFLDFSIAKLTWGQEEDRNVLCALLYDVRSSCRFSGADGEKEAAELMAKTLAAIRIKYNYTKEASVVKGNGAVKEYYKIPIVYGGNAAYNMAYESKPLNPVLYITHKVEDENGERFDVVELKFVEWSRLARTKKWWESHVEEVARKKKVESDKKALREKQFKDAGLKPEDLRGL